MRRVLAYARVSSVHQAEGSSLGDQQESIRRYATSIGLDIHRFFVESESAVAERFELRAQVQQLLHEVKKGDLVLCDKLDRWSRDPEFTWRSIREIHEKGASFFAVADRCDPSTPDGDTMLHVRVLVAREEHKRIKQRLVGTRRLLRDRGYYVEGLPPLGYRRQSGKNKNILVVDPLTVDKVKQMFELCAEGHSISQIAVVVGEKRDRVKDTLRNRVYLGEIENTSHIWIPGFHPPIIEPVLWLKAQAGLDFRKLGGSRPNGSNSETSGWLLRDVARCGHCSARMAAVYGGPKDKRRYYYRCRKRCTTKLILITSVEPQVSAMIVGRLAELREFLASGVITKPKRVVDTTAQRDVLLRKRDRLLEMYADGVMDKAVFVRKLEVVDSDLMKLANAKPPPVMENPSIRRELLGRVENIETAWRVATGEVRRRIAGGLIERALLALDRPPKVEWKPLEALLPAER